MQFRDREVEAFFVSLYENPANNGSFYWVYATAVSKYK